MSPLFVIVACIYLCIAFYTDLKWMIIPNWLTLIAAAVGIGAHVIINHWNGLMTSILGLLTSFAITFVLYLIKGIGAGDVKGIAALGAIMGTQFAVNVLVLALIYAGVVGICILILRGRISELIRVWWVSAVSYWLTRKRDHLKIIATHQVHSFPFMIAVLPAFITCLVINN